MIETFVLACDYERLDQACCALYPAVSRARIQKWIKAGCVALNGAPCDKAKQRVVCGDTLCVTPPADPVGIPDLRAEPFDLPVLYEDDDLLIIDKPPDRVVHPAPGHYEGGTIVNALLSRVPEWKSVPENPCADEADDEPLPDTLLRPGIVHRLDKDTSGCLILAKNSPAQSALSAMFAQHAIVKHYRALSYGIPAERSGHIATRIGRHPAQRLKMANFPVDSAQGRLALSDYTVIQSGCIAQHPAALIDVELYTGRTHQIRLHLKTLNTPVLGDAVYGGHQKIECPRQMLHAFSLDFTHPFTHKKLHIEAPLPPDFCAFLAELRGA